MRAAIVLPLVLFLFVLAPVASADVGVRTCDSAGQCRETLVVESSLTCYVDVMKGGLGKPPSVRLSQCE